MTTSGTDGKMKEVTALKIAIFEQKYVRKIKFLEKNQFYGLVNKKVDGIFKRW